jgi:hypothetical protein
VEPTSYIGLDLHKRKISYCMKDRNGKICAEGSLPATRMDLGQWMLRPGALRRFIPYRCPIPPACRIQCRLG